MRKFKKSFLCFFNGADEDQETDKPAIVQFAFGVVARAAPAKVSCRIDMRRPRGSECLVVFDPDDELNKR